MRFRVGDRVQIVNPFGLLDGRMATVTRDSQDAGGVWVWVDVDDDESAGGGGWPFRESEVRMVSDARAPGGDVREEQRELLERMAPWLARSRGWVLAVLALALVVTLAMAGSA